MGVARLNAPTKEGKYIYFVFLVKSHKTSEARHHKIVCDVACTNVMPSQDVREPKKQVNRSVKTSYTDELVFSLIASCITGFGN